MDPFIVVALFSGASCVFFLMWRMLATSRAVPCGKVQIATVADPAIGQPEADVPAQWIWDSSGEQSCARLAGIGLAVSGVICIGCGIGIIVRLLL